MSQLFANYASIKYPEPGGLGTMWMSIVKLPLLFESSRFE